MQSPLRWSEDASWKLDYNNVAQMSAEELARRRAEVDERKRSPAVIARRETLSSSPPCGRRWREAPDEGYLTAHSRSRIEPLTRLRFAKPPLSQGEREEKKNRREDPRLTRPFEGVKILDFTQVLAGPYASYQLALLGADVIKVERREGEDMRRTPLSREWADRGLAPGWQAINGNKRRRPRSIFSKPEAIKIVKELAAQADVVMENFRPGVMDKLGIGYAGHCPRSIRG